MTETTVDAAVVDARFAELEHRVEQGVSRAVEAIATTAERYLDPDKGALKEMLDDVEKSLGETFDPTSRASVLAKFEALLTGGTVEMRKVVRDRAEWAWHRATRAPGVRAGCSRQLADQVLVRDVAPSAT